MSDRKRVLVTGSSGYLGKALCRWIKQHSEEYELVASLDKLPSDQTTVVGDITDRELVKSLMAMGIQVVYHVASLHKPHVEIYPKEKFIETNITGTLILLEEATAGGVEAFIFTSTTSTFGDSLVPKSKTDPAAWITEDTPCIPKNIYGVTKCAAEDLCRLFSRNHGLNTIILKVSRFFPEPDDDSDKASTYSGPNLKLNEYLYRRGSVADMVSAHVCAAQMATEIKCGTYIITATHFFAKDNLTLLRTDPDQVVAKLSIKQRSRPDLGK